MASLRSGSGTSRLAMTGAGWNWLVVGALGLIACIAPPCKAIELELVTEDAPPVSMLAPGGSEASGLGSDIIRQLLDDNQVSYVIHVYPWKRAYDVVLKRSDTCIYSIAKTPDREKLFKWAGPLLIYEWALFGLPGSSHLKSLDEARGRVIGAVAGDAEALYLERQGFTIDPAVGQALNMKKLLNHRIDYWASGIVEGNIFVTATRENGLVPVLTFGQVPLYLACNPSVPDALVARLDESIARMRREGSINRIRKKYE